MSKYFFLSFKKLFYEKLYWDWADWANWSLFFTFYIFPKYSKKIMWIDYVSNYSLLPIIQKLNVSNQKDLNINNESDQYLHASYSFM